MEQEKTAKNISEVQEIEQKEERSKKILIILMVLLLFGGTCYYYSGINNLSGKEVAVNHINKENTYSPLKLLYSRFKPQNKTEKTKQTEQTKTVARKEIKQEQPEKKLIAENPVETTKNTTPEKPEKTKLAPTGKSTLLSLAGKTSGKNDPFSYSESQFIPFASETGANSSYNSGTFPPVPGSGSIGNLPSIPGLPSMGLAPPPSPKPTDLVVVKGFIGNKVIAEIDGVVESLNVNERVNNIKVLTVNPSTLTAKFEIKGKTVTKTLQSLTDENNENIQLVKNLHN